MGGYAWVTLATNDAYSLGALVLAHSLRQVGTKYEMAVLITPGVTQTMREKLSAVFSVVMEVNVLDSKDEANLALLARPELGVTFTKLHCWRLTQYEKCVFLDADTLVVRNCDELFEREELSAAPDVGWPDCFNSGVFVYRPCQQTFASITAFAAAKGSFDGGDQGLLNMYFSDWARKDISKHLPFIYNMCSTAAYSYLPAFKQFGDDVRIIHFIGITKPWLQYFDTLTGIVQPPMDSAHLQPLLQLWWNIFCEKVHPQLSPVMATSTLAPIWHKFSPTPYESHAPKTSIYTDIQDKVQNDIYLGPPDFSEFQDPWENYSVQNDPAINKTEDNETQQYYSTVNNSPPTSILSEQFSCPKSVHQTHNESSPDHSRDVYHRQQYTEYSSSSCNQHQHHQHHHHHHHHQEQSNQFVNQNAHQQSPIYSTDTSISDVQPDHWQNQHSIENSISVHSVQSHHSDESQHHVDYQCVPHGPCYDNSRLVLEKRNQYEQVDHQYNRQHSFNDSNKSKSVEVTENQRKEPYVEHQCNHYQVHGNVNNEQVPQHYEQKNQVFHTNSQTDFRREEQKPLDVKVVHDQGTKNSIVYRNDPLIQQNTEQVRNIPITDERTNTLVSTSPYPVSKPCTDFHNVASQSDPEIGDDLNSSNAGLAGALAQITLGAPRSAEQIALEEHMRKQSWEQGHIDYMGRDSFDNIWKKICETLALAPPRSPSPPKEIEEPEKTKTDKTEESTTSSEAAQSIESIDEVDKVTAQTTTSHTEEQYLVNNVPITNVPKILEKNEEVIEATSSIKESKDTITQELSTESRNQILDTSMDSSHSNVLTSHKEFAELSSCSLSEEALEQAIAFAVPSDPIHPHSIEEEKAIASIEEVENLTKNVEALEIVIDIQETTQPDIRDEKHAKELSTASEILTISPVPIQVAESVLQVEPKESMSDSQITSHEILSSTITPVHLTEAENKVHINGLTSSTGVDTTDKLNELPTKSLEASQTSLPVEQTESQLTVISQTLEPKSKETEASLREAIESTPEAMPECEETETSPEAMPECEETETSPEAMPECEGTETSPEAMPECEGTETSPEAMPECDETPVRPSRAKELGTSSTGSPKATQEEKSPEMAIKKTVKMSTEKPASEGEPTETTDGDSIGKKVTKKVVKKVVKKPKAKSEEGLDDGAEDSSSPTIKQKKTAKVVKKGTKFLQTPATDPAAVPETPSSSTSDAPVPPKRKTKATAAKTVTKKSDIKQ